jgi:hypothetical protein
MLCKKTQKDVTRQKCTGEKSRLSMRLNSKVLRKKAQSKLTLEKETNFFFLKESSFSIS